MDAKKIKELCALGENSKVQYKHRLDNPAKIAAEIVTFANYRGRSHPDRRRVLDPLIGAEGQAQQPQATLQNGKK